MFLPKALDLVFEVPPSRVLLHYLQSTFRWQFSDCVTVLYSNVPLLKLVES